MLHLNRTRFFIGNQFVIDTLLQLHLHFKVSIYLYLKTKLSKALQIPILNYISLSQFVAKTCKRSCENASKHDVTSDFPKLWIFFLDIGLFATFVVIVFEVENGIKVLRDTLCFSVLNIDIYIEHWIQINV